MTEHGLDECAVEALEEAVAAQIKAMREDQLQASRPNNGAATGAVAPARPEAGEGSGAKRARRP